MSPPPVGEDRTMARAVTDSDIELAHHLAAAAAEVAMGFVAPAVAWEAKADGSPVSAADIAVEAALIELLARHRPTDGVLSEESGEVARGDRRWILDPIDGTSHFVTGAPDWGTHIALEVDGQIVLGIITRPLLGQRWWAATGCGAFVDGDGAAMAKSARLALTRQASVSGARVGVYSMGDSPVRDRLRAAGATVVEGPSPILELLEGRIDAVVSDNCGLVWDHAPAVVLVTEAGGRFVDPVGGSDPARQGGLYANEHLHGDLRRVVTA